MNRIRVNLPGIVVFMELIARAFVVTYFSPLSIDLWAAVGTLDVCPE